MGHSIFELPAKSVMHARVRTANYAHYLSQALKGPEYFGSSSIADALPTLSRPFWAFKLSGKSLLNYLIVKCYPSVDDNSGACEACRASGRKCLFSLKGKLGRPRKMTSSTPSTRSSTMPSNAASTTPTSHDFPNPSMQEIRSNRQSFSHSTTMGVRFTAESSTSQKSPIRQSPISQAAWESFRPDSRTERQNRNCQHDRISFYDSLRDTTGDESYIPDDPVNHQIYPENSDNMESVRLRGHETIPFSESYKDIMSQLPQDLMDFSKDDFGQISPRQSNIAKPGGWSGSQLQIYRADNQASNSIIGESQEILQIYSEIQKQSDLLAQNRCSLLAQGDQDNLRQIMDTLGRMSRKISAVSNALASDPRRINDQSLAMVIFASIIQAMDNVSRFTELGDHQGYGSQAQPSSGSSPRPVVSTDEWGAVSGVRLDLIIAVTRLDFFLMQFKAFITSFNCYITVISVSHPAELIARLHHLHQRIGLVLERLQTGWA
ncbi:hypothetical protein B0O99DRAFT_600605 [Bisporella sp. PMI_857]|nr:hypothetical protein B0O99DRAFT_600605 [Bisporella sp. PMI_857]